MKICYKSTSLSHTISQAASSSTSRSESESTCEQPEQTASDEQCSNSPGLELSTDFEDPSYQSSFLPASDESFHCHQQTEVLVDTALLARIEYLEAENDRLKNKKALLHMLTSELNRSNMMID